MMRLDKAFPKFFIVGTLGFVTDAGILYLLLLMTDFGPILGRFLSFFCANLVTWQCNRHFTFPDRQAQSIHKEWFRYFTSTSVSTLLNMGIYVLLLHLLPEHFLSPLVALIIAAVQAMCLNFVLLKHYVFKT